MLCSASLSSSSFAFSLSLYLSPVSLHPQGSSEDRGKKELGVEVREGGSGREREPRQRGRQGWKTETDGGEIELCESKEA